MLKEKATYRIIALLALIVLLSVAAIIEKTPPDFLQEFHQEDQVINQQDSASAVSEKIDSIHLEGINKPEKKMFAGGLDPKMLKALEEAEAINKQSKINKPEPLPVMNEEKLSDKNKADSVKKKSSAVEVKKADVSVDEPAPEAKAAIQSIIDLRYGRHKEYMRVVFDGPHDIISEGKVRHKDNEVSVTFADSGFLLKKEKIPIPVRREKNKVIFQKNNLEKIRVHNLSNPSRLAIDFYTKREDSEQQETPTVAENGTVALRTEALESELKHDVKTSSASLDEKKSQPAIKTIEQQSVVAEKETIALRTDALETELKNDVKTVKAAPSVEEKAPVAAVEHAIHEENVQTLTEVNVTSAEKEKALADATIKEGDSVNESKTGSDRKVNQVIKAEAPAALAIPAVPEVTVPAVKPVTMSPVKTVQAEKSQPVAKKKDQRLVDQKNVSPVKEAPSALQEEVSVAAVEQAIHEENVQTVTEVNVTSAEKEKALADASINDKDSLTESKTGSDRNVNQGIKVEAPVALVIPAVPEVTVPAVKPVTMSPVKTVQAEKSQSAEQSIVQKAPVQEKTHLVKKVSPAVEVREPVAVAIAPASEAEVKKEIKYEAKPAETEKSQPVVPEMAGVEGQEVKIKEKKERIALLPFDNFSGNSEALDKIMPLIVNQLEHRGYDVIDSEEVEGYLCEKRIRYASSISREVAAELGRDKMVNTAIAGSVLTFSSDGNPKIGILARQLNLETGHIMWSDFVSLTGEDYTKVLGLGTINSIDMLIPDALNNIFAALGKHSQEKDGNAKYRIAVLPFKNESKHRHAGMIITHLFQNELANNQMFDTVDYGELKRTIVNLRVGSKGEVDYNNLQALSKLLGVDVVLTGTVEEYQPGREYHSPPIVTISARLLDSRKNRILWYDNLQLDGEENIIALDWGRLRSADKVAYEAVSGLVDNIKTEGLLRLVRLRSGDNVAYGAVSGLEDNIKTEGLLR